MGGGGGDVFSAIYRCKKCNGFIQFPAECLIMIIRPVKQISVTAPMTDAMILLTMLVQIACVVEMDELF